MQTTFIDVLVSWGPMLLLILVWLVFMTRYRKSMQGQSGRSYGQLLEDYLAEMKRTNDLMQRMLEDQGRRIERLEARKDSGGA